MPENFYDLLGVDEGASQDELKRAYRAAVREHHPDVSDAADATERFRRINRAYRILSNPEQRKTYDRLGHEPFVDQRLSGKEAKTERQDAATTEATSATGPQQTTEGATTSTEQAGSATQQRATARASNGGGTASTPNRTRTRTTTGSDTRSDAERARVRRRMQHRRVVSRHGEPTLALATFASFGAYLIGVREYVSANRAAWQELLSTALASPGSINAAIENGATMGSGAAFAAASAAGTDAGLFLPLGAALLPVTLLAAVMLLRAPFRHPIWWLVPVIGCGPAVGLVLQTTRPGVLSPDIVAAGGYIVAPILAAIAWVGLLLSRL